MRFDLGHQKTERTLESPHNSFPEDTTAVWQEHASHAERKKESGWERGGPAGFGTTSNPQALGG